MVPLNNVMPNLKAAIESSQFKLDTGKGLASMGEQIVQSIADGIVPLDSGLQLLNSLASLFKI